MADALFGKNWQLNRSASIFSGSFEPASETRLYEERENGYKLTVKGINNGKPYEWWYEAFHDGKPYPVHGRADADSITIYKLSETETCGFFTKNVDGQIRPAGPYRRKVGVSSLEVETAGRNPDGSAFYDVISYS